MSKFKEKLLEILEVKDFNGLEFNCYNLGDLPNHPTLKTLFNRLTEKGKLDFSKRAGNNSIEEFLQSDLYQDMGDDPQDFENCDIQEFADDVLKLRIGGDWQLPAIIKYELVNGEIVITDFYFCEYEKKNIKLIEFVNGFSVGDSKPPRDYTEKQYKEADVALMKLQMEKAVIDEDFIKAAELRDKIKELEEKLNQNK
jgi:hypothetical protein